MSYHRCTTLTLLCVRGLRHTSGAALGRGSCAWTSTATGTLCLQAKTSGASSMRRRRCARRCCGHAGNTASCSSSTSRHHSTVCARRRARSARGCPARLDACAPCGGVRRRSLCRRHQTTCSSAQSMRASSTNSLGSRSSRRLLPTQRYVCVCACVLCVSVCVRVRVKGSPR